MAAMRKLHLRSMRPREQQEWAGSRLGQKGREVDVRWLSNEIIKQAKADVRNVSSKWIVSRVISVETPLTEQKIGEIPNRFCLLNLGTKP